MALQSNRPAPHLSYKSELRTKADAKISDRLCSFISVWFFVACLAIIQSVHPMGDVLLIAAFYTGCDIVSAAYWLVRSS